MRRRIGHCLLELVQGDLTRETTDAIVNAANEQLVVGGGVDGAIHQAGGPEIRQEILRRYPNGCPTGSAVMTGAGALPAKSVIHAVGPAWKGGRQGESERLRNAYRSSLQLAASHQYESVAFPAISTGVYGYPVDRAATDSLETIIDFLKQPHSLKLVRVVLFGSGQYGAFARALQELLPEP